MRPTASLSVFRSFCQVLPQDGRIRLVVIVAENVVRDGLEDVTKVNTRVFLDQKAKRARSLAT